MQGCSGAELGKAGIAKKVEKLQLYQTPSSLLMFILAIAVHSVTVTVDSLVYCSYITDRHFGVITDLPLFLHVDHRELLVNISVVTVSIASGSIAENDRFAILVRIVNYI